MDKPSSFGSGSSFEEKLHRFNAHVNDARDRARALQHDTRYEQETLHAALAELEITLEELANAQEELRSQNEALLAARMSVEIERQRYRELFEFAPDGYLLTDVNGVIQEANRAAAQLLRVNAVPLIGKPLPLYVDVPMRRAFRSYLLETDTVALEIRNAGSGFPSNFSAAKAARTGLELVENLTRHDLGGAIHYENPQDGGARVTVTFPHPQLSCRNSEPG